MRVLAAGLVLLAALLLTPASSRKVDVIVTGTNPVGVGLVASRALGLAIPPSLRLQADRIVE